MRDKDLVKSLSLIYKLLRAIVDSQSQREFKQIAEGPLLELKTELESTGYADID